MYKTLFYVENNLQYLNNEYNLKGVCTIFQVEHKYIVNVNIHNKILFNLKT